MKKKSLLIVILVLLIIACSSVLVFGESFFGDMTEKQSYGNIEGETVRAALINQDSAIAVAKTNQTTCISTALIIGGSLIISAALKRGKRQQ